MIQSYKHLESLIAVTPDWPIEGVLFRDISPLLATHFNDTIEAMATLFTGEELAQVDAFAGIDARGFIFASALAAKLNKNMVMIRKGGKLPPPAFEKTYQLEYGEARLELKPGQGRVIVYDDVVATGGSMRAAAELCEMAGYKVKGFGALIDLKGLNSFSWQGLQVRSLFKYA